MVLLALSAMSTAPYSLRQNTLRRFSFSERRAVLRRYEAQFGPLTHAVFSFSQVKRLKKIGSLRKMVWYTKYLLQGNRVYL